jgi:hypothetical protein
MLRDPVELAVLGSGVVRELHYRIPVGPQGGPMIAALQQAGTSGGSCKASKSVNGFPGRSA